MLDSATSRALGYEHVTVLAGQYPVDYLVNPHGQLSPDVITQGQTLSYAGLPHTALGQATLMEATDGALLVSNIGSSGQDGVSVALPSDLTAWEAHWQPLDPLDALPVGAYVREALIGTGNGVVNGVLGTLQVTKAGTSNHVVSADFSPLGASTYTVQAYRQGVLVAQATNQPGAALAAAVGGLESAGFEVSCCPLRWRGWLDWGTAGTSLSVAGTTVSCDNLYITPEGVSFTGPPTAVEITASQIPSLTITSETKRLTYAGLPHTSLGSAIVEGRDGWLYLGNIGSSGQDGVEIQLNGAHYFDAQWLDPDPAGTLPVGAYVQSQIIGTAGTVVNGVLGSSQITKVAGGGFLMTADFSPLGTSTRTVEVYNHGELVARVTGQTGPVGTCSSISWDVSWECCPSKWDWSFELGASLALNGGPTVLGDRVLLIPEGPVMTLSQTAGRILLSQIPSLTITNEIIRTLYGGLDHSPLGTATLTVQTNGTGTNRLVVSNLGSSGQDGVEIRVSSVDKWHAHWLDLDSDNTLPVGAFVRTTARGPLGGLTDQVLGSVRVQKAGNQAYDVSANFSPLGASTRTVEAYFQGALVARVTGQSGPVGRASSGSWSTDFEAGCCPIYLTISVDWRLGTGTALALNGGPTVITDHIFITPEGGTPLAGRPTSIWLQAAQIPSLVLTQEVAQVRYGGVLHSALGDAALSVVGDRLEVSNLGSSGQDGVEIAMPNTADWGAVWLDLDPNQNAPVGAYVREQAIGTGGGVVNGVLATVLMTKTAISNCVVVPDFSPLGVSTYTLQVYNGSNLVTEVAGQSGPACSSRPYLRDIKISCCPLVIEVSFELGTSLSLASGSTVIGDRVYLIPEGAPPVSFPTAVRLQASQIPSITFVSESAVVVPTVLNSTVSGDSLTLQWIGGGVLQESSDLGTWSNLAGAASPCKVPVRPVPIKFYRVRQ